MFIDDSAMNMGSQLIVKLISLDILKKLKSFTLDSASNNNIGDGGDNFDYDSKDETNDTADTQADTADNLQDQTCEKTIKTLAGAIGGGSQEVQDIVPASLSSKTSVIPNDTHLLFKKVNYFCSHVWFDYLSFPFWFQEVAHMLANYPTPQAKLDLPTTIMAHPPELLALMHTLLMEYDDSATVSTWWPNLPQFFTPAVTWLSDLGYSPDVSAVRGKAFENLTNGEP
ncbi:hypothetical protein BDR26DRAFT_938886 [Obelidium mucronatum]|nr:hypothetical protein BDR26DRAFT_938886 [Obelidium mucronatum]